MGELTEPLLGLQPPRLASCVPLRLRVLRHKASDLSIVSKHGEVVFRLCKAHPYNPFSGIEWQLWDALDPSIPRVNVKKAVLRSNALFETVDGVSLTHMTQKLGNAFSELQWDDCTYRWESVGCAVPLQLQLTNTATGQHVASLEGSISMPWSREQQHITILAGREDHVWLQVVIASGLAEAKRLGGENANTAPRRFSIQ